MRIFVAALAGLAIGGMGLLAPAGVAPSPLGGTAGTAAAQPRSDAEPAIPPLPTRKDEKAAREALKRRLAEDDWVIFKAPEQLFSIALPAEPRISAKPVAGHTPLIQHDYQVDPGDGTAYHAIVFEYPEGRAPEAGIDYFRRLINAYAEGSGSSVTKQGPVTIARRRGYEATTLDKANGLTHLIDLLSSGDRIYMLVTAGPADHARSEEARRFRQSFRLIDPDAVAEEEEETVGLEPPTPETPAIEETAPATPQATEDDLAGEETAEAEAELDDPDADASADGAPEEPETEAGAAPPTGEVDEDEAPVPSSRPESELTGEPAPETPADTPPAAEEPETGAPEPEAEPETEPLKPDAAPEPGEDAVEPEPDAAPEPEAETEAETDELDTEKPEAESEQPEPEPEREAVQPEARPEPETLKPDAAPEPDEDAAEPEPEADTEAEVDKPDAEKPETESERTVPKPETGPREPEADPETETPETDTEPEPETGPLAPDDEEEIDPNEQIAI